MACPDENTIAAFLEGALSRGELVRVEGHVDRCAGCRSLLVTLVRGQGSGAGEDGTTVDFDDPTRVDDTPPLPDAEPPGMEYASAAPPGSETDYSPRRLQARDQVDQYRVIRSIGRGGMGSVYLARDTRLGRKVALKVIHAHLLESRDAVNGFLVEARNTARFNHPHIVTLYGVGEYKGTPYMALEYLEGQTLRQRMDEERQGLPEAMRLGLAIARALEEAHGKGVLHLDLTANNVVIPRDGRARVLDFGLSQAINPLRRSETGTLLTDMEAMEFSRHGISNKGLQGTPAYMAPEQWQEQELTASTDIWPVGLMLYQLVVGRHPFAHPKPRSVAELVTRVCAAEVQLPEDCRAPPQLQELILRCLSGAPGHRPEAAEVAGVLARLLDSTRDLSTVVESPYRGMLPFSSEHAGLFFGREADLAAFLERLRLQPVLPVVGTSGAGKSSFVGAGVVPRLQEQGSWRVIELRPGFEPMLALAQRVLGLETGPQQDRAGEAEQLARELERTPRQLAVRLHRLCEQQETRVLLFVDQLEELYTLVEEQPRRRFLQAVLGVTDDPLDPVRLVFTMRDDFLGRLAELPEARRVLGGITLLGKPEPEELTEMLQRPLDAVEHAFDDAGLVPDMVAAVQGEAGSLPLLQFTARMLWDRRDREKKLLLRGAYEAFGGVEGALATHADGVLDRMAPGQVRAARELLLRLITPERTRRLLPREVLLDDLGPDAGGVLDALIKARLVSVGRSPAGPESMVELVHEALARGWGRLTRWLDEAREDLLFLDEASKAATLWEQRDQREDELWRGAVLADARRFLGRCSTRVPPGVTRFLEASVQFERRQAGRRQRLRWLGAGVLVLVTLASLAAAWALADREREARRHEKRALQQQQQARARFAEAGREGARSALARRAPLEARAKLRSSLEAADGALSRVLWWRLSRDPLLWQHRLGASVYAVALSPDNKTVAAASPNRAVYLFDTRTRALRVLRGHGDQVSSLAFGPRGAVLASGGWGTRLRLWDLKRGTATVLGKPGATFGLAISPDGKLLAAANRGRDVELWDLTSRTLMRRLEGHPGRVRAVAFHPTGGVLACGSRGGTIRFWDTRGWTHRDLPAHTRTVFTLAFDATGRRLASGGWDRTIRIWDWKAGKQLQLMRGHSASVVGLAFADGGESLVSASWDRTLRRWSAASGKPVGTALRHEAPLAALAAGGGLVVTGGWDKTVRLWRRPAGAAPREAGHSGAAYGLAFSPDSQRLLSGGTDKTIRQWDVASGAQQRVFTGHASGVTALALSPDGKVLASASQDRSIRLWDPTTGAELKALYGHSLDVTALTMSPDGKMLASGSVDHSVRLWDLGTHSALAVLRGHTSSVRGLDFSPDSRLLASGAQDSTVHLWDVRRARAQKVLRTHKGGVFGVSFGPHGRQLVTGSVDRTVQITDLTTGKFRSLGPYPGRVYQARFGPRGRIVGAPLSNGTARLYHLKDGRELTLRGHRSEVNYLSFSPDGSLAATSSDDGTVRLWETATGRPHWRAPLMLSKPARLLVRQGWRVLARGAARPKTPGPRCQATLQRQALQASAHGSSMLCVLTLDAQVQLWDQKADRLLWTRTPKEPRQVAAVSGGCAVRTGEQVLLLDRDGGSRVLAAGARALSEDRGALIVALANKVRVLDGAGRLLATHPSGPGVSAMARVGGGLVLGFREGTVEVRRPAGSTPAKRTLGGAPSSAVVRIIAGPARTLISGHAGGFVGIWDLGTGTLLDQVQLHGPAVHLLLEDGKLHAATELGHHVTQDLSALTKRYCKLLRQVWRQVPVVWERGAPRLRPPPPGHRCR